MNFLIHSHRAALFAASLLLATSATAQVVYYTAGHGDLGVEYETGSGQFEAHWHLGAGAVVGGSALTGDAEFEPGAVVGLLETTSTVANPVAAALGVAAGSTVFRTGITAYPPNVGFALEEVGDPGDWVNESITLSLSGFSGPGEVALSQTISGLGTIVWFSSREGSDTVAGNAWEFGVGGHQHLDWFFTEAGFYELTLTWTGTHIDDGLVQGSGTFGFQVGAIPEPSSFAALAGLASLGLVALRRKPRA